MSWEEDLKISKAARVYQDELYKSIFPIENITRLDNCHILDRSFHIDLELELTNGIKMLGQEKALRKMYSKFDTFTIEFYQNRYTKEKGEFFNLGAQFYCHGYLDGDTPEESTGFLKVYVINIFDFLEWLKKTPIEQLEKNTRRSSGLASFYYINYNNIPEKFIYYNGGIK